MRSSNALRIFGRRGEEVRPKKEDAWLKLKSVQKLVVSTVPFREEVARLLVVKQSAVGVAPVRKEPLALSVKMLQFCLQVC